MLKIYKKIKDWFWCKPEQESRRAAFDYLFLPSIDVHEYDVVILDPNPENAIKQLTEKRLDGWTVVQTYCENQIILERMKRVYIKTRGENNESQAS